MRELELAVHPSIDPTRRPAGGRATFPLSRAAFVASIAAHVVAGYALSRHKWAGEPLPDPIAEFFLFEMPATRPAEAVSEAAPVERPPDVEEPQPEPQPRVTEVVPEPTVVIEPAPASEVVPVEEVAPTPPPTPFVDLGEARQRAAREVVTERAAEKEYLTFAIDDVAPPRPVEEPEPTRSIFDGGDGADFGGRSVATVGQQRTKIGRKLVELCNALTGGFGVALQGFGLFSACASPDNGPSGLFPEVRPAYLDLMPECVDTRDTAPALALEAPFPTIKCRLVKQAEPPEEP